MVSFMVCELYLRKNKEMHVEIKMEMVDDALREIMKKYQIKSIETKKNSLEQFFIE